MSLSINAASEASQIFASAVCNLNPLGIFDGSGLRRSSIEVKVSSVDGSYISQMNLVALYSLSSLGSLGSGWVLPCQPAFIGT